MYIRVVLVFAWLVRFLCICRWVQREKKYLGSPFIVAVSMALTEGNGPYSNPLKDEGYKRFKCTETRGRTRQKKRQGRDGEAHPTPHWVLIRNGRHFIKKPRRLSQKQEKTKKGRLLFILHHDTHRVYLSYHNHRAPEHVFEGPHICNLW